MNNILYIILSSFIFISVAQSQEYKVQQSTGTLILDGIDHVAVTGYDGSEIIFQTKINKDHEESERAAGLKMVNAGGITDNTGLGISVTKTDGNVLVEKIGNNCDCEILKIQVPRNMNVDYSHNNHFGEDFQLKGISGEIVISTLHNSIYLEDVTGPMAVKTVHGSIEAKFSKVEQSGSISLNSVHDFVDVTMPANSKCTIKANTNYGNIYSGVDIETNANQRSNGSSHGSRINGKMNGGGVNLSLTSSHNNVYIRKK